MYRKNNEYKKVKKIKIKELTFYECNFSIVVVVGAFGSSLDNKLACLRMA